MREVQREGEGARGHTMTDIKIHLTGLGLAVVRLLCGFCRYSLRLVLRLIYVPTSNIRFVGTWRVGADVTIRDSSSQLLVSQCM